MTANVNRSSNHMASLCISSGTPGSPVGKQKKKKKKTKTTGKKMNNKKMRRRKERKNLPVTRMAGIFVFCMLSIRKPSMLEAKKHGQKEEKEN